MEIRDKYGSNSDNLFNAGDSVSSFKLIRKFDLIPLNNLKMVFRDIRDFFAGNVTGITRDEKIAQNIIRLLLTKIYDEKRTKNDEILQFANRPGESVDEFSKRINNLFKKVKGEYSDIIDEDEEIEISPSDLSYIVSRIEKFSLLNAERDIIADAFEELIGKTFRGGEGQFFTPRNVVQMMIEVLKPSSNERIIDPACGSGGFLAHILQYLINKNSKSFKLMGIDKDLFLSKLAKIYLTLIGNEHYQIFCENSLDEPKNWKDNTKQCIELSTFDLVLTNPPFGAKIPVIGSSLLKQYHLGYNWTLYNGTWTKTNSPRDKQPPQVLFIERVIQLLKTGGRAGIVLPEGIFGNPSERYIWEFIKEKASIIGVISLSQETFQPSTHTKTSVLFFEKIIKNRKNIFMGIANSVGHDKNGKPLYKSNGINVIEENHNILDDDLPIIAEQFACYLELGKTKNNHLGFLIETSDIKDNIYIPEHYNPELKEELKNLEKSGKYKIISFNELLIKGIIQIKRGNEIGSQFYGTGEIPFVRTTDIVNWEIKMDPIKAVSEDIYMKYKSQQDVREKDILFVNDGTFLIGRTAMITRLDVKCILQSHLRKIRALDNSIINPYYLFYLLNTKIVQKQIQNKTFIQATLSTLGNRIKELLLPVHTDPTEIERISMEIQEIIDMKTHYRERSLILLEKSI